MRKPPSAPPAPLPSPRPEPAPRGPAAARLLTAGALWAGVLLTIFDAVTAAGFLRHARVQDDFRLAYLGAHLVAGRGWPRLYDFAAQRSEAAQLGFNWQPYVTPPPLVALAAPLSALPFEPALALWTGLLLAALVAGWWLAAPGAGAARWMHLALALGLFPAAFAVAVGQPAPLVLLAVAGAWSRLRRDRDVLAGLCLGALALKPQLGLLIPPALLVAGRWRAGASALAVLGLAAAASALLLGGDGLDRYRAALADAATWSLTRRFTIADVLPAAGPWAAAGVVALTAVAARRGRAQVEIPLAAGLAGSLLVTPYIGLQDFAMLLLAGWLILRTRPPLWMAALLGGGYVLLEVALLEPSWPLVLWRLLLLAALAAQPYGAARQPEADRGGDQRLVEERVGG